MCTIQKTCPNKTKTVSSKRLRMYIHTCTHIALDICPAMNSSTFLSLNLYQTEILCTYVLVLLLLFFPTKCSCTANGRNGPCSWRMLLIDMMMYSSGLFFNTNIEHVHVRTSDLHIEIRAFFIFNISKCEVVSQYRFFPNREVERSELNMTNHCSLWPTLTCNLQLHLITKWWGE
jgi:hypothetical protein